MKRFLIILLLLCLPVSAQLLPDDKPMFGMQLDLTSFSTRGLVFWSAFVEAGNLPDLSFGGNDGTITGATWVGGALEFGSSDWIDLGDNNPDFDLINASRNTMTVIAIVNSTVDSVDFIAQNGTHTSGANNNHQWALTKWVSGNFSFVIGSGAANNQITSTASASPINNWYHVAATVDDAKLMKIYVDGILHNQATYTVTPYTTDAHPSIALAAVGGAFIGQIADVKIYNRALSATEIQRLFINPNEPILTDPIWMFFQEAAPAVTGQVIFITQ